MNNIDNPRTILNGTVIVIPDKDDMKAIANENDPDKKKLSLPEPEVVAVVKPRQQR